MASHGGGPSASGRSCLHGPGVDSAQTSLHKHCHIVNDVQTVRVSLTLKNTNKYRQTYNVAIEAAGGVGFLQTVPILEFPVYTLYVLVGKNCLETHRPT